MAQGKTVIKVVTAMTSAQNPHGGQGAITYIDDALGRDKMPHQCIQIQLSLAQWEIHTQQM